MSAAHLSKLFLRVRGSNKILHTATRSPTPSAFVSTFATSSNSDPQSQSPSPSDSQTFVQQTFTDRDSIAQYLSNAAWSSKNLFTAPASPESDKDQANINSALVSKLVKQAGFPPVEPGSAREQELISNLKNQLVFVDNLLTVDTNGIEPLVRIGDSVMNLTFADMKRIVEANNPTWIPVDLAAEKNGNLYVLKEGLRRED